jgi:hypothetical protein
MARLFEIIPVGTTEIKVPRDGGSVERDLGMMYAIEEGGEEALDLILEPYGQHEGWYLDRIQLGRGKRPWAYVALRREYDIGAYISARRREVDATNSFAFTIYDERSIGAAPPKVACLIFFSKNSLAAAAEKIQFLRPASSLLRGKAAEKNWLVLLDEEPADVISEATRPSDDQIPENLARR